MKPKTKWQMRVYFLDACNCDWGCPCQFNAKPTHGNCEGVSGIHIIKGNYGSVKFEKLNMAFIGSWPGAIHEGRGKASFYIDDRANDDQFDALAKIIVGKAGGGPFEVYRSTINEMREPRLARITFQANGLKSHVKVGGIAEAWLEPIRNPVTGKVHRAIIELPEGFEASRMDMSSTKTIVANDGFLDFRYSGTYGSFQEVSWKGP
ncbi:MAG TPA: DUF1326 domain-containing protein [Nitrososphaera sp.]|nr:DUF1326 domain-containing protein [Nitrososphaera sp.]